MSILTNDIISAVSNLPAPIQVLAKFRIDNIHELEKASSKLFKEMIKADNAFNNTDNVKVQTELKAYKAELYKKQTIYKTGANKQLELLLQLIEANR